MNCFPPIVHFFAHKLGKTEVKKSLEADERVKEKRKQQERDKPAQTYSSVQVDTHAYFKKQGEVSNTAVEKNRKQTPNRLKPVC